MMGEIANTAGKLQFQSLADASGGYRVLGILSLLKNYRGGV